MKKKHNWNKNWIKLNFISNLSISPNLHHFSSLCICVALLYFASTSMLIPNLRQRRSSSNTSCQSEERGRREKNAYEILNANRTKDAQPPTQFERSALHIIFHLLCFLTTMWCGEHANNVVVAVMVVVLVFFFGGYFFARRASIRALISIKPERLPSM